MEKHMPRVSVILPVYNGQKYLKTAIDSILNQTYHNLSLIIIDDGSTDKSNDIINSYTDSRICHLKNEENRGLIFSLNRGLDSCDGEYAARMDCDDFSLPNRIEKQVEFMENHPHVGVCGSWFSVMNEQFTKNLYTVKPPEDSDLLKTMLFLESCMCHPSTMFRMSFFNTYNLRYNSIDKHAEDYGLWVEGAKYFEFANSPEVLLHYRSTPTGICHMHAKEQKESTCRILTNNLKNIGINNPEKELLQFHFRVAYGLDKISTQPDRTMLVNWFNTMKDANHKASYYNENNFLKLLVSKTLYICPHLMPKLF